MLIAFQAFSNEEHSKTQVDGRFRFASSGAMGIALSLMEMYLQGVSTRKLIKITEEFVDRCSASFVNA